MAIEDYEELKFCQIFNATNFAFAAPLLEIDFGAGFGAGAITAPYGLQSWTARADVLPDMAAYPVNYSIGSDSFTDTRFQYFFDFYKRHLLYGNKPFVIRDPRTRKKFLVCFAEKDLSFEAFSYQLYAGGAVLRERRSYDLMFNADGSIFNDSPPAVTAFTAEAIAYNIIRLTFGTVGADGFDLEWTTNAAADLQAPQGAGGWTAIWNDHAPAAVYDHTGRSGAIRYYYRLRVRDEDENISLWTGANAITPAAPDLTPPVIEFFNYTNIAETSISMNWLGTDNDQVSGYDLQFSTNGGATWNGLLTNANQTSYTHTPLSGGTSISHRLRARDRSGNYSGWIVRSATTLPPDTTPPTVSITSPANGATISGVTNITVLVSDDRAVQRVEYYLGVTQIAVRLSTDPSFNLAFNPAAYTNGSYQLSAIAFDFAGNQSSTASIGIIIDNPAIPATALTDSENEVLTDSDGEPLIEG